MKKKINLENLSNSNLFGSLENNRIKSLSTTNLKGGTSTALCKTVENTWDTDPEGSQESLADGRCTGY